MKYLALVFCLSACGASLPETILPRTSSALEGLKEFYLAVCSPPPDGQEQVCEDARGSLNEAGEVYNLLNDTLGGE